MNVDNATDRDLLGRMLDGDREAFAALYRRRQPGIYRFALHMSGSPPLAEDVVHEVFLTLIGDGHRYEPSRGPVVAYLYGIARNLVLRRAERYRIAGQAEPVCAEHLESDLARGETVARVRAAVLALPPHYREVVLLCDLEEMEYEEAAETLGCAVGTVRSRLHRARRLLAERLRPAYDPALVRRIKPARCTP
jgi:RNA polymerase sigma-70 factor (ECF subfamily)